MKKQQLLLIVFFINCFFWGSCDKESTSTYTYTYEEFEAPTVNILSTEIISDNEYEVKVQIDLGIGASIEDAYIDLLNITTGETTSAQQKFTLTQEKIQLHTLKVKVTEKQNDYRIKLVLKSQKNEYSSKPEIIRFSEKVSPTGITQMKLHLGYYESDFFYVNETTKVGKILRNGDSFMITIYYSVLPPETTKFEVKLHGEIPITSSISFRGEPENGEIFALCTLPTDIAPGIYPIHVYVNDVEYILEYKIKAIKGVSRVVMLDNMPYDMAYLSDPITHFVDGDEVHYIHSEFNPAKMIIYNLKTHGWDEKSIPVVELPYTGGFGYEKIINGMEEYLMHTVCTRNPFDATLTSDSQWIVSFDKKSNQWKKITDYPGQGTRSLIGFGVNNKLYIGGGVRDNYQNGFYTSIDNQIDFWEYDISARTWSKKRNLPYETFYNGFINSSVATSSKGYAFTRNRDLWQYNPSNDSWTKLNPLKDGPIYRNYSKLLSHNDNLYLVGGHTHLDNGTNLSDFWKYDLSTGEWSLIDMFDVRLRSGRIETFIYKDKVMLGYSASSSLGNKPLYVEIDIP